MADEQKPRPLTGAELDQAALRYLNRFDATAKKLSDYLLKFARKRGELAAARPFVEELIARYRGSGLLDDARFARVRAQSLQARGASRRLVAMKLGAKGVARQVVDEVLAQSSTAATELEAARAYVKRKRLGHHRPDSERQDQRQKDLSRLARQGFSFETAAQALIPANDEDV